MAIQVLKQIHFRSLPESAAQALRDAIIARDLQPGSRLVEQKLAADLGIGQPTLREALKELEYQGFVRKVPNKGTYVTKLTKEDFRKILEVRLVLEILAIEQAARNMTEQAARELEDLVGAMDAGVRRLDLAEFHRSDVAFHSKTWSMATNEYLQIALERVAFALFAFVLLERHPNSMEKFSAATVQHRIILEGLRTGDPAQAREAFVSSTLHFWNVYHQVGLSKDRFLLGPVSST